MTNRAARTAPRGSAVSRELRKLAAFTARGGAGTPAAGLAAELAVAAENADTPAVCRLAEQASADPQLAAATLGVLAFALADTARRLAIAQAATLGKPG